VAETHVTHHHPTRAETRGFAEVYALVVGILLTVIGLAGFFADAHFDSTHQESFIGLFDVNGWANLIHLIAGVLGLVGWKLAPRPYAAVFGIFWVALALWGFYDDLGDDIVSGIPSSVGANWFHLALGALGIAAAAHGYFVQQGPRHDDHAAGTGRGF
jgi:Domain of unknown function (DUF4383)